MQRGIAVVYLPSTEESLSKQMDLELCLETEKTLPMLEEA